MGGGGKRSSGSSSSRTSKYFSPTIQNIYKPHTGSFGTNLYFLNNRTYKPLLLYFRPDGYYNEAGYYSNLYELKYYDGYGYNFFTGNTNYYQDSPNNEDNAEGIYILMFIFISLFCFVKCMLINYLKGANTNYKNNRI